LVFAGEDGRMSLVLEVGFIFSLHILSSLQVSEEAERLRLSQTQTKNLVKKLRLRLLPYVPSW
jgi:hypothetical protein